MTTATNAFPGRREPILPSPHIPVRRHAVLHEQELAARPKHATHFGERHGGIWNAAQGPGGHNDINAAIIEWNGFCRRFDEVDRYARMPSMTSHFRELRRRLQRQQFRYLWYGRKMQWQGFAKACLFEDKFEVALTRYR